MLRRAILPMIAAQCALVVVAGMFGLCNLIEVRPPADIYTSNATLCCLVVGLLVIQFGIYAHTIQRWQDDVPSKLLWGALLAVTLLSILQTPTTSRDVYSYVTLGRISTVYGLDPYLVLYPVVSGDPFAPFVWFRGPSPYGPLALVMLIPAAWLSQVHPALGIVFLKLVGAGAHLSCAWLVWRLAAAMRRDAKRALFVYGFNPLLLHELVANGHNDSWAVVLVLTSVWLLQFERVRAAALVAWLPMLIKLSLIATSGATAVLLAAQRRFGALLVMLGTCVAGSAVLYVLLSPHLDGLLQITDPAAAGRPNSIYHWLELALVQARISESTASAIATRFAQAGMVGIAGLGVWRATKIRTLDDLVAELAMLFLVLLLFGPRVWPWYLAWAMPLAVLGRSATVRTATLVYTCTSVLLYAPEAWPRIHTLAATCAILLPAVDWLTSRRSAAS